MIKKYRLADYSLTQIGEVDLWDNLANNFYGKVLDVAGSDMPEFVEIEFASEFKDEDGKMAPLNTALNIKEFERALASYQIIPTTDISLN